jgi:hypothetical protein
MKNQIAIKLIAAYAIGTRATGLFAHENHGFSGSHWHATDVWGFVAMGAMAALAIWLYRNGK